MSKIDLDGDGKADISISLTQIITIAAMFASIIGSYYTLSNKINIAEEEIAKLKYNQKEYPMAPPEACDARDECYGGNLHVIVVGMTLKMYGGDLKDLKG